MSNRSSVLCVVLTLAFLAPASSALAWPTVEPEGHRVPVLAGRWTVAMPDITARAASHTPLGAPPAHEELDSAALLQTDEGNFGVRAALLESTRPEDLAAAVRALPAPCATPEYGTIGERTDVVAIRCTEPSPDGAFRPISVYAVHPDGWVDRIEALVETTDPANDAGRTAGVAYAEAVMATLTAGQVAQPVERGAVDVGRACEAGDVADHLTLTLPTDWIALRDSLEGGGELLRIMHVVPLGTPRAIIAVQLDPAGTEPPRVPEGAGRRETGTLLGADADWLVVPQAHGSVRQLATEITVDCGGGATYARSLRLSLGGPTGTTDDGLHVLETMALVGTRGHTVAVTEISSEEAPIEAVPADGLTAEDRAMEERGHFWSIAIGAASLLLLVVALVMRGRTTKPK